MITTSIYFMLPNIFRDFMMSGVQFYQGPSYVNNCYFDHYKNWYYNDSFINQWGIR